QQLGARLKHARESVQRHGLSDSPLRTVLQGYSISLPHLRADTFADQRREALDLAQQMADARTRGGKPGLAELQAIEEKLGAADGVEPSILVELFLSYRACSGFEQMVSLHERMPEMLKRTVLVR